MGTCQSRSPTSPPQIRGGSAQTASNSTRKAKASSFVKTPSKNGVTLHLFDKTQSSQNDVFSPSGNTNFTAPETPYFSTDASNRSFQSQNIRSTVPSEENKHNCSTLSRNQPTRVTQKEFLRPVEPQRKKRQSVTPTVQSLDTKRISDKLTKDRMLYDPAIKPESMVHHTAPIITGTSPLIAPRHVSQEAIECHQGQQNSVDPQTMANFNRLKIQVELAEKNEIHNRRKAKLQDRIGDVEGYRELWKEFEELKLKINKQPEEKNVIESEKNKAMNLHQPASWYFDFEAVNVFEHVEIEDDGSSMSSLSLLSETAMEAQKEYYMKKGRERRKKRDERRGTTATNKKQNISVHSSSSSARKTSKSVFMCADYGRGRESKRLTVEDASHIGSDDSTPRTRTGKSFNDEGSYRTNGFEDGASYISDLDMENDYDVPRRHRQRGCMDDDSSLSTCGDYSKGNHVELKNDHELRRFATVHDLNAEDSGQDIDIQRGEKKKRFDSTPKSRIQQYGFDPAAPLSSQLELFAQSVPSVQIEDATSGRVHWREDSPANDQETPARALRLDDIFQKEHSSQKISWEPRSVSKPVIGGIRERQELSSISQIQDTTRMKTVIDERPQDLVETEASPSLVMMSPSQFMMMSSHHDPDLLSIEDSSLEDEHFAEKLTFENTPTLQSDESDLEPHSSPATTFKHSKDASFLNGLDPDPTVENLSTDAFLLMSSWPGRSVAQYLDADNKDVENEVLETSIESISRKKDRLHFDRGDISDKVSSEVDALLLKFREQST